MICIHSEQKENNTSDVNNVQNKNEHDVCWSEFITIFNLIANCIHFF